MINKLTVQSIIDKYYLGTNESVKWIIENNSLSIDFMTPTKDVIGKVTCKDFELEDSKLAIYDTKKLNSLISMQNCEWAGSATPCGRSNGAQDSYKLHIKIKDATSKHIMF